MESEKPLLVIADIDGTLSVKRGPLPLLAAEMIRKLHAEGIQFGVASGRPADDNLRMYTDTWNLGSDVDVMIGMNGGQVYIAKEKKLYESNMLSRNTIRRIIEMMAPLDLNPFVYDGIGQSALHETQDVIDSGIRNHFPIHIVKDVSELYAKPNHKVLYRVRAEDMPRIEAFAKAHADPAWRAFRTQDTMLEFSDPETNKGDALKRYCTHVGIPLERVWAFGDMQNDNEMLLTAGKGIALKSGSPETKKIADDITEYGVEEDGFGHYLEKHLFGK